MREVIFAIITLMASNSAVFATAQTPDKLIYEGITYNLHANPLETYFEKYPGKRPKGGIMSSALWRGYVATFILNEGVLFLKDIEIEIKDRNEKYVWKSVFEELLGNVAELKIDWLTGVLIMPYGEIVDYVHLGYATTYCDYLLITVEDGVLCDVDRFDYNEYMMLKEKLFERFSKTDKYKKLTSDFKRNRELDFEYIETIMKELFMNFNTNQ